MHSRAASPPRGASPHALRETRATACIRTVERNATHGLTPRFTYNSERRDHSGHAKLPLGMADLSDELRRERLAIPGPALAAAGLATAKTESDGDESERCSCSRWSCWSRCLLSWCCSYCSR